MRKKEDEFIKLMAEFHAAHDAAMVILVKTLEEAGTIQSKHYEVNLRMFAETLASKSDTVTRLLLDLAEKLNRDDPSGTA